MTGGRTVGDVPTHDGTPTGTDVPAVERPAAPVVPPAAAPPAHVHAMDALRGVASLLVVLGHARELMAPSAAEAGRLMRVDGSVLQDPTALVSALLLVPAGFAREAVGVFFALSGFWVGGSVLRGVQVRAAAGAQARGAFTWPRYLVARLSRLWIVLVPALVLTAVVDAVAVAAGSPHETAPGEHTWWAFLGNVFFLQPRWVPVFGWNVSLWSLSYELWFYLVLPAALLAASAAVRRRPAVAVLWTAAVAAVVLITPGDWVVGFLPWVAGAATGYAVQTRPAPGPRLSGLLTVGGTALLLAAMLASTVLHLSEELQLVVVGGATLPLLVGLPGYRPGRLAAAAVARTAALGGWSYSLYAYHAPLLIMVYAFLRPAPGLDLPTVAITYLTATVVTVLCWLLSRATEHHTDRLRRALTRRFLQPAPVTPAV